MDGLRHRMLESAGEQKSETDRSERSRKAGETQQGAQNARSDIHNQHNGIASTIEFEIVPRLVLAHRTGFTSGTTGVPLSHGLDWRPGTEQVAEFSQIVLSRDVADAVAYIDGLRNSGTSLEAIYLDLLAPSARYLGDLWEEDLADFTAVTVGLWRLQQIVRDLGSSFVQESDHREQGRRLLLAPGMGEQHSFGLFMVGEFFRRAGWDVWAQGASTADELVEIVRREWFAVNVTAVWVSWWAVAHSPSIPNSSPWSARTRPLSTGGRHVFRPKACSPCSRAAADHHSSEHWRSPLEWLTPAWVFAIVKRFKSPKRTLGDLDAEAAGALITAAADVTLIIDAKGVIRDMAFGSDELARELNGAGQWIGQPWVDTVATDSRSKVESLIDEARSNADTRWRQVNHSAARGGDIPVLYSTMQLGRTQRMVAVGRDLRAIATLQQRLVDAQQSMERDYWRLRHAETRYRLLFQMASEAVMIVDSASQKIVEANPAADHLFGEGGRPIVGRTFPQGLDAESTEGIQLVLARVRSSGRADDVRVRLADGRNEILMSAFLFRQEDSSFFLVRLASPERTQAASNVGEQSKLLELVRSTPDGFVVTGPDGRILSANRAFLDLAQIANEEQVQGESLDRWLGRPGVDLNVMIANLRQHGSLRLFATTLRGEYGFVAEVEISAVSVMDGDQQCCGFMIRNVGPRVSADGRPGRELPRSVEQLTELVGRVSLKDMVREATDVIERLCIEAALELTGDNRASAAEMLGLSRQSLYVKLRRYGLGDLTQDGAKA